MKRIIISDTHIGSKYSKTNELIDFLKNTKYDQLILAGDIIDFIKVPSFDSFSLDIIDAIDFSKEIIYVVGNHDISFKGFIGSKYFGINFVEFYDFEENGKKFRIEHGHAYDEFKLVHNNLFMNFISVIQNCIEHLFEINISDWYSKWKSKNQNIQEILDYLKSKEYDVFIIGHFHKPEIISWCETSNSFKTYVNSGDWVSHATYVEIEDGNIKLLEWQKEKI